MDERLEDLRSTKNPKARIKVLKGHFATSNSHLNTYIDMSTVKSRHNNAREAAKELAHEYMSNTFVNTIVCLLSAGNNISVITPEFDAIGQMMFRDNKQRMIKDQQVLILAASVTTGKTINRAIECVLYYGGTVCGVASIFSAVNKIAGMEIKTIFTARDIPDYRAYEPAKCPMCEEGKRVEAIVNSYGYSKL